MCPISPLKLLIDHIYVLRISLSTINIYLPRTENHVEELFF